MQFVSKPAAKRVVFVFESTSGSRDPRSGDSGVEYTCVLWPDFLAFLTISDSLPTNESLVCQENTFEHFQERTKTKPQYAKCQLSFHGEAKKKIEVKNSSGSSEVSTWK